MIYSYVVLTMNKTAPKIYRCVHSLRESIGTTSNTISCVKNKHTTAMRSQTPRSNSAGPAGTDNNAVVDEGHGGRQGKVVAEGGELVLTAGPHGPVNV